MCAEDFSDTSDLGTTATQSLNLDTAMSLILAELETLNVHQANIESATLSVDLPLRYRSGQPLYMQDWRFGAGHAKAWTAGTGAASARDTTKFLNKGASWKLTGGSDGGKAAYLQIEQGPYENVKISFEFAMTWEADIDWLRFSVIWMDGSDYFYVDLTLDVGADEIQIFDDTSSYHSIRSPIRLTEEDDCWNYFKLTVDFSTGDYVEAYINEDTIDLSAYTMLHAGSAAGDPMQLEWRIHSEGATNPTLYIDAIAIVEEE